jgi:hypothetical protein
LTKQNSCPIIAIIQKDAEMKLNAAQLAALARGASQEEIAALATAPDPSASASAAPAEGAEAAAAPAAAAPAAAAPAENPDPSAAAAAPAAPAAAPAAAPDAAISAEMALLKSQLTETNAALIAAKVEAEGFKAQAAQVDPLVATLRTVIGEKLVALGGSADIAAGYTAANIVAEFSRIDGVFKKQFRVGGVAAVASPEDKPNAKVTIDPMFAAAVENSIVK